MAVTGSVREGDEHIRRALLSARARFFLVYRLTIRASQLLATGGAATRPGAWRSAFIGFVALDVVLWWVLRRPERYGLWWRLLIDTADIAFWSLSPYPDSGFFDLAVLVAVPLAAEAGFRQGWVGLLVMAIVPVATSTIRIGFGRPALPFTFGWLLLATAIGIALSRYCRRLHEEAERERRDRCHADRHRAFLAGQNAVAMGASSVVDAIEGVVPILGQPPSGSALWALADGWKMKLGHSTAGEATYLQVALRQWETTHNRHPDLMSDVHLLLPEGDGTVLLTGSQVADLSRSLTGLALHGPVSVRLADSTVSGRLPGGCLELAVGGQLVVISADARRPLRLLDPGPISFVYIAAFVARGAARNGEHIPVPAVAAGVAICLVTAWWSHVQLKNLGRAARPRIVYAALGVAAAYTTLASLTMRNLFSPEGDRFYGFSAGLLLIAFLAGTYHESLTRRARALAAIGAGMVCTIGWVLPGGHPTPKGIGLALSFALTPYLPCRRMSTELTRAAADHLAATTHEDRASVATGFAQGRAAVLDMVWRARDDANRQLEALGPRLEPERRSIAVARLEEVDQRLDRWAAPSA